MDGIEPESAPLSVWIGLSVVAAVSFWCQATVTEERFVPALNVIATEFKIPDDVAGATLMAAGASSPELFSSIVSLFITHSALGLGTIVGSEIFNQLIICAGAVFAARGGRLELDKAILVREVGFYALSIALLFWALQDQRPADDDDEDGPDHIYISFFEASVLFATYVTYVLVCSNFEAILGLFARPRKGMSDDGEVSYGSMGKSQLSKRASLHIPEMPFLKETTIREPPGNFPNNNLNVEEFYRTATGGKGDKHAKQSSIVNRTSDVSKAESSVAPSENLSTRFSNSTRFSDGASVRLFRFLVHAKKPSDQHELYDMEVNNYLERLSCFLWQRSYFYDKARFAVKGWHLRWFTFTHNEIHSIPDRVEYNVHQMTYPSFEEIEVDEKRLIIKIINPRQGKRNYYLMAPSTEIFNQVVLKIESMLQMRASLKEAAASDSIPFSISDEPEPDGADNEPGLIEFPLGATNTEMFFFVLLFPLRFIMHFTVPDVRLTDASGNPTSSLTTAFVASFACLVWLIIGSYAMVASLEDLADLMDIPEAVVGFTVSAAGTSLPNYVASKVAAEKGFGNMAVSNAFGSNTFNILVGLGLPWVLYTSVGTGFEPYHGLRNDGILESVIILGTVLALFIVITFQSGFVLYKWHGNLFIALYVAYVVFAVAQVYL